MPMYEFECRECGDVYEELLFSSTASAPCPRCGSDDVAKLFSTFASNAVKSDKCTSCKPKPGFS